MPVDQMHATAMDELLTLDRYEQTATSNATAHGTADAVKEQWCSLVRKVPRPAELMVRGQCAFL